MFFARVHSGSIRWLLCTALVLLGCLHATTARAQCGPSIGLSTGGETDAVAVVNATTIAVGRGNSVELFNTFSPGSPVPFSPRRVMLLEAPAKKIVIPPGSPRMFILMDNGDVCVGTIQTNPIVTVSFPTYIRLSYAIDIAADGQVVYILTSSENFGPVFGSSLMHIYDLTSGTPSLQRTVDPFLNGYFFDRLVKIGNTVWIGMHEYQSSIYGLEAYDVSNPANPVRVTTALNNVPLGTFTRVGAMHAIGNRILMSYGHPASPVGFEDWMRAVDVTVPTSLVWHPQVDLNGIALCMASTGNLLRISIDQSGVGTWDTSNPAALAFLGAYFDTSLRVGQMVAGVDAGTKDYWAAGRLHLLTMNTGTPASPSVRSTSATLPVAAETVRQFGNTMVALDRFASSLYLFDMTTPSSPLPFTPITVPSLSFLVELGSLSGGAQVLAVVATGTGGSGITIYDITNPASPFVRANIPNVFPRLMSVFGSRLYVLNQSSVFQIYELSQQPPALRSSTPFGGIATSYTCMTSWDTGTGKAVALGTQPFGLWIINTTDATAPLVSTVWNPVTNYRVAALTKGPNFLYVSSWIENTNVPGTIADTRLESLNVNNPASVSQRWVATTGSGAGRQPLFAALTYASTPSGKFLIGSTSIALEPVGNRAILYELPPGFFTGEGIPFVLSSLPMPFADNGGAVSATGSRVSFGGEKAGIYAVNMPSQWAPGFGTQPADQTVCYNATAQFSAIASANPTSVTYQWVRSGPSDPNSPSSPFVTANITDGPTGWGSSISGSATFTLTISNARPNDRRYRYRLVATNSCGTTNSFSATIIMCPADFNCAGGLTAGDIFDFLNAWFAGSPAANFDGRNGVDVPDVFSFLNEWFEGC